MVFFSRFPSFVFFRKNAKIARNSHETMLTEKVEKLLSLALEKAGFLEEKIILETPKIAEHGDIATPIALGIAKKTGGNPREIAEKIRENIPKNDLFSSVEIAGAGFLNFIFSESAIAEEVSKMNPKNPPKKKSPKKIVIDFSHPNIAKPLHFGHFRSTVIGDSLVRILRFCGNEVIADNFLGNWGTNFGKLIVALEKWGDAEKIAKRPMEELVRLYQQFYQESEKNPELETEAAKVFHQLEVGGDAEIFEKWKWIVSVSLAELQKFYDRLGVQFDEIRGEQFYEQFLKSTLQILGKSENAVRENEGALVMHFDNNEKLPNMIFQKSDGATLYQTRDLARILFYEKEQCNALLYVVSSEQGLHFRQVFLTAKQLGVKTEFSHVSFGLVLGTDGKKFSTRRGNGIGLDEVLDEAEEKTREKIAEHDGEITDELVRIIALGALKWNDLSQNRMTNIVFDWKKMLDMTGFSGPFVQYSAVRIKSIFRKSGQNFVIPENLEFLDKTEIVLAKRILGFFPAVEKSAHEKMPHFLAQYLFDLAGDFNGMYAKCPISGNPTRLLLTAKTGEILEIGLHLLGIETPEKM